MSFVGYMSRRTSHIALLRSDKHASDARFSLALSGYGAVGSAHAWGA